MSTIDLENGTDIELQHLEKNASNFSLTSQTDKFYNFNYQPAYDYVDPLDNIRTAIKIGSKKAASTSISAVSTIRIILKSMMSGSYLGFSITLTIYAISQGWDKVSAALLFPTGFVMLILMGNDLATGNFALLPMAYLSGRGKANTPNPISITMILLNWLIVYTGNFMGTLTYLFFLWGGNTHFGQRSTDKYSAFKDVLCAITESKSIGYYETGGAAGWFAAMFNGLLCNWMVTMGVLLAFSSKSTIGKIFAMYIPITLFITLGFEHSIVNLFLFPAGFAYQCDSYNVAQWWIWNQIPVTLGNMFGGICLTGIMYFVIWGNKI
eukprot:264260_1